MIEEKIKQTIKKNICYTELVYSRINKKLNINFSKKEIEKFMFEILEKTNISFYIKKWKNFYISNTENKIKITVNSHTYRIITVDKII